MRVILVSGHARSGKDTIADMLKTKLGKQVGEDQVLIIHFADLLKFICKQYFGWDGEKDQKGRQMLQYVGTDVIRKANPNYWVDFVTGFLTMFKHNWEYAIISDCRFPNEVECVKQPLGALHIRVERPNYESALTSEQKLHPSETALDGYPCDCLIQNDGTLDDLSAKLDEIVEMLQEAN